MLLILGGFYCVMGIMPLFFSNTPYIMNILIMILIWAVVASCWDVCICFGHTFRFAGHTSCLCHNNGGRNYRSAGCDCGSALPQTCRPLCRPGLIPFLRGPLGRAIGSGGAQGILTIPPINFFGVAFSSAHLVPFFYLTFFVTIICTLILALIIKSYWGTAFLALKDSENFATSLGISAFKYKLLVFAITSFITGLFGALYAHYVGMLSTKMLSMDVFTILMIMMVIGGIGKYPGVVVGAVITVTVNQLLAPMGMYRPLIMGALVVILVLFLRDGVVGLVQKFSPLQRKLG